MYLWTLHFLMLTEQHFSDKRVIFLPFMLQIQVLSGTTPLFLSCVYSVVKWLVHYSYKRLPQKFCQVFSLSALMLLLDTNLMWHVCTLCFFLSSEICLYLLKTVLHNRLPFIIIRMTQNRIAPEYYICLCFLCIVHLWYPIKRKLISIKIYCLFSFPW